MAPPTLNQPNVTEGGEGGGRDGCLCSTPPVASPTIIYTKEECSVALTTSLHGFWHSEYLTDLHVSCSMGRDGVSGHRVKINDRGQDQILKGD